MVRDLFDRHELWAEPWWFMLDVQEVFIGGVTPPTYIYSSTPLQRSYSWNIPGCTRNFPNTSSVRYSQTGPQLQIILFGLLHEDYAACCLLLADARIVWSSRVFGFRPEDKRRLRGPLFIPRHDALVDRSPRVFVFRPEDKRRRESSMFTPVGFNVLAALSSRTFGNRTESGVPNNAHDTTMTFPLKLT